MKPSIRSSISTFQIFSIAFTCLLVPAFASCNIMPISADESAKRTELRGTELEVSVKQTLLAQQLQERDQEKTQQAFSASAATPKPNPAPAATMNSQVVVDTPISPAVSPPTAVAPAEPSELDPEKQAAFQKWLPTAKILLYEDMIARLDTVRYVSPTLDKMGLNYKDDGSAFGWLLDDLKKGPADGGPWDLIIIAAEDKEGMKVNVFSDVIEAIDQGTSIILEEWYLDGTYNSSASEILSRCGVEFEKNWVGIPPAGAVFFPLSPDHPILNNPNRGLNYSSSTGFWWDPSGVKLYDTGDLVRLAPGSQAELLLGTTANTPGSHGVSAVCLDGQLIMQTFSSHVLTYNSLSPLWENYITHALQTRFSKID